MRIYGKWAGNPKGVPENETRCIKSVSYGPVLYRQCSRKRGHGERGLFCKQHSRYRTFTLGVPHDE